MPLPDEFAADVESRGDRREADAWLAKQLEELLVAAQAMAFLKKTQPV